MIKEGAGFSVGTDALSAGNWLDDTNSYLLDFWNEHPGSSPSVDQTMSGSGALQMDSGVDFEGNRYFDNHQSTLEDMFNSSSAINNGNLYSQVEGKTTIDKLKWLIEHDPENARAWTETLLGYEANLQNTNDARAYEMYMQNTRVQRTAKDLEAAGINPLLAYQYLSGTSGSVGTAGYPDSNVSTSAETRAASERTKSASDYRNTIALLAAFIAVAGVVAKAL